MVNGIRAILSSFSYIVLDFTAAVVEWLLQGMERSS
jgi:hypothetical protein